MLVSKTKTRSIDIEDKKYFMPYNMPNPDVFAREQIHAGYQNQTYLFSCKYIYYLHMILGDRMVFYEKDVFPTAIGTFMQSVEGTGSPTAVLFIAVQRSHCNLCFNRIL